MTLKGWIPGRVYWDDADVDASTVEWLYCDEPRFTDAFLDDTFARLTRRPANVLFRRTTTLAELEAWAAASPGIIPTGFVFHVSRCGSTLLSTLLGLLPGALVLSEPNPVDSIIRAGARLGRDRQTALLRAMVSALGQVRTPGQDRLFIKFDAWNTLQLPLIRAAFPDTPWVFLYRDPVEVMVSALARRGVHTVPSFVPPALFGLTPEDAVGDPAEYTARVLGAIYQAGLDHHDPTRGLLLNYTDLPEAAWSQAATHFGVAPSAADIAVLRSASATDPKKAQPFRPDAAAKRAAAGASVRAFSDQWMRPAHAQLDRERLTALPPA